MRFVRYPVHALAGAVTTLALAFSSVSLSQAQELQTINVITSNDASCSPYPQIVSDEFGFFAKAGIKVNLLSSSTQVPFVAFLGNQQADIVMLDPGQVLQAANAGQDIAVIYEAYQGASDGIVVPEDSDIKSVADLKGKTIGLATDRDRLTTTIALSTVGLTMDDVTTAVVGESGVTLNRALTNGEVHAYAAANSEFAGLAATGFKIRNITPVEVSQVPGNSWTVWKPTLGEKRDLFERFLRAWAMGQHTGVMDTKAVMSACKKRIPEQWEEPGRGETVVQNSAYNTQIRRTVKFGELQRDVWESIQGPYIEFGEIDKRIDIDTFLDPSFIDAAN